MIRMESNHCQMVSKTLIGERPADEQTLASLEILSERLSTLKKASDAYAGVEFSPYAKRLRKSTPAVVVG